MRRLVGIDDEVLGLVALVHNGVILGDHLFPDKPLMSALIRPFVIPAIGSIKLHSLIQLAVPVQLADDIRAEIRRLVFVVHPDLLDGVFRRLLVLGLQDDLLHLQCDPGGNDPGG